MNTYQVQLTFAATGNKFVTVIKCDTLDQVYEVIAEDYGFCKCIGPNAIQRID